ncbi:LTA synthase family protein [Acholeplasma hippikon]|nr:alkaline phosphatase family protein [Acholeplasma hippikon]
MKKIDFKKHKNLLLYIAAIGVFFIGNLINTYFLTTSSLNKYLVSFDRTFVGELNSLLGNMLILFVIYLVVFLLVKNQKKRLLTLAIVSFGLNVAIFSLTIFTKYYGTIFSFYSLTLFKNPAVALGLSIVFESFKELITYYRIILFIPFAIGLTLFFLFERDAEVIRLEKNKKLIYSFSGFILSVLVFLLNLTLFWNSIDNWPINANRSTYAAQNVGIYNYYLYEIFGENFTIDVDKSIPVSTEEEYIELFDLYNTNKEAYTNFIDKKIYQNKLTLADTNGITYIDESLLKDDLLNGMFEDKNVMIVHLESLNYFVTLLPELSKEVPFLNELLKESYVLDNFYNSVGVGTSADAEYTILSGLQPDGKSTIYWDFLDNKFDIMTLPKLFKDKNYYTEAIHGDTSLFYNREVVYDEMMGFDNYYSKEDFDRDGYDNDDYDHENPWLSDRAMMDYVYNRAKALEQQNQKYFLFPMTIMPHTPYLYDPYDKPNRPQMYSKLWNKELSGETLKYIYYLTYYNEILERLFVDPVTKESRVLDNTVYLFYGDHGTNLLNENLSVMFKNSATEMLTEIEYRKHNAQVAGFIYVPGNEALPNGLKKGMLKGSQTLVRTQADFYRTTIELFNLDRSKTVYFGTNLLSKEPGYSVNNRILDIYTNTYDSKTDSYGFKYYSMINSDKYFGGDKQGVVEGLNEYIILKKQLGEVFIQKDLYKEWYKKINE